MISTTARGGELWDLVDEASSLLDATIKLIPEIIDALRADAADLEIKVSLPNIETVTGR